MKVQMRKPAILIAIGALALPLAIAFAQDDPAPTNGQTEEQALAADVNVSMRNMRFTPDPISIRVGQTVKWTNTSSAPHTVTDDPSQAQNPSDSALPSGATPFDSGTLSPGKSYTKTFTVPGTYKYFCKLHEKSGMVGTITVNP